MVEQSARCRLYLVTPSNIDLDEFPPILSDALKGGDVACLQLRLKDASDDNIRQATKKLMPICLNRDVAFILNDRPDLAAELDTDGVHIGQQDSAYKTARGQVGEDRIVGVTCHDSRHLAINAAEAGADYVAFGAFYPSTTKNPATYSEIEIIEWWSQLFEIPCVAIGGITLDNCLPLINAGTDFLAVSGGIWEYPGGPKKAVREFNETIARATKG